MTERELLSAHLALRLARLGHFLCAPLQLFLVVLLVKDHRFFGVLVVSHLKVVLGGHLVVIQWAGREVSIAVLLTLNSMLFCPKITSLMRSTISSRTVALLFFTSVTKF